MKRQRIIDAANVRHARYKDFHDAAMRLGEMDGMALLRFSYQHTLANHQRDADRMRARVEDMLVGLHPQPERVIEILAAMDAYRAAFIEWEKEIAGVMAP